MKKMYLLCAMAVAMASCQSVDLGEESAASEEAQGANTRDVRFVMKGLNVDYGVTSKATVTSEGMTDLWIWEGSTLLKHQVSGDSDFGSPTVSLTVGAHDLTFVTSKATGQSWAVGTGTDGTEQGVWSCSKVADTYGTVLSYTVLSYTVSGSSSSKQVGLSRCNGKLRWTIEDAVPTSAAVANISMAQCYGLDGSLNGVKGGTYSNSLEITSVRGITGVTISAMVLPEDHENGSTISPTITITDGTNNICSYTNEVTVSANVVTNIHGSFFSGQGGLTMVLNSEWGEQRDVDL